MELVLRARQLGINAIVVLEQYRQGGSGARAIKYLGFQIHLSGHLHPLHRPASWTSC